jgi:hypothetical protein
MKTCIICKKKTDELYAYPEVDKVKYPICSIECFSKYLDLWSDEKNFPNNLTKKAKPAKQKHL